MLLRGRVRWTPVTSVEARHSTTELQQLCLLKDIALQSVFTTVFTTV